jgi:multicomponent Na+:H+ antiporter subunit C
MILLLSIAISICVAAGVWLLLSRDLFRVVIGLSVLGSAVNLIVFIGGRPGTLLPPVIEKGSDVLAQSAANPLPQALVLTAIVIGFALLCFSLVLAARLNRQHGHTDIADYQASEPSSKKGEPVDKPPVME